MPPAHCMWSAGQAGGQWPGHWNPSTTGPIENMCHSEMNQDI